VAGKVLAIAWPISAFVALGFEHSVANMYLLPIGMLLRANLDLIGFAQSLFWVSLGNVAGGGGGVGLVYWTIYVLPDRQGTVVPISQHADKAAEVERVFTTASGSSPEPLRFAPHTAQL
jgi:hypothetical protein